MHFCIHISVAHCNGISEDAMNRLKENRKLRLRVKRSIEKFRKALTKREAPEGIFDELGLNAFDKKAEHNLWVNDPYTNYSGNPAEPIELVTDNDHKEVDHPELDPLKAGWTTGGKITKEPINQQTMYKVPPEYQGEEEEQGPTLFTVANTDTDRPWEQIPYREKFQWSVQDAPCHVFILAVPDERDAHGEISLCIYRRNLEYQENSAMIIHKEDVSHIISKFRIDLAKTF
jgi:hypothetical protein